MSPHPSTHPSTPQNKHPRPESTRPRRLKALCLGAAGGALVLAPLGAVLLLQGTELEDLAAQRAALDPLTDVVGVQRGLLAHRETADQVLRGRQALEPERRQQQSVVDDRLHQLQDTLAEGQWPRALQESQGLVADWQMLAHYIELKQITADNSQQRHQVLLEQVVQVLDIVEGKLPTDQRVARSLLVAPVDDRPLAALESRLQAQAAQIARHQERLLEQRGTLRFGLGALAAMLVGVGLAQLLRRRGLGKSPPPPGIDGTGADPQQRRNHGRRATDAPPQRALAKPLLERLRSGEPLKSPEGH